MSVSRVKIIDSHTGGEPTRVVIDGGPDLGQEPVHSRLIILRRDHDPFRSAVVCEPRGSDVLVGALLQTPHDPECVAAVIFFNNVGYLGMCGHGTIGVVQTLAHLGRIGPGEHRIETPVGIVKTTLGADGAVEVENVPSYRFAADIRLAVAGLGIVQGEIAWGGNWFFLAHIPEIEISRVHTDTLIDTAWRIRQSLAEHHLTGRDGEVIDHIELYAPSPTIGVDCRCFVLCPGKAYDRSPCGTGTSAKMACLHADGKLRPGDTWRQEAITGSVFEGRIAVRGPDIIPTISGRAYITSESTLLLDPDDPFCWGL